MRLQDGFARIRPADVERLNEASEALAAVHTTIKASKASYLPACEALLIRANDIILAIRDHGLANIKRALARMEDLEDQVAREKQAAQDSAAAEQPALATWPSADHDATR
jgi:hypothetical protein